MGDQLGASVQSELVIDPVNWYILRELKFKPPHFVTANTPVMDELALKWIIYNLRGRYTLASEFKMNSSFVQEIYPSFEDPHEALLYELKWS